MDVYCVAAAWSAPSAIGTAGLGVGTQAGAEMTDFLIVLNSHSVSLSYSFDPVHVCREADILSLAGNCESPRFDGLMTTIDLLLEIIYDCWIPHVGRES